MRIWSSGFWNAPGSWRRRIRIWKPPSSSAVRGGRVGAVQRRVGTVRVRCLPRFAGAPPCRRQLHPDAARRYKGKLVPMPTGSSRMRWTAPTGCAARSPILLEYSRVARSDRRLERCDFEFVLAGAVANLQTAIRERAAVVTHDPMPTAVADGPRLTQLFQNLIGNAIKFGGASRRKSTSASNAGTKDGCSGCGTTASASTPSSSTASSWCSNGSTAARPIRARASDWPSAGRSSSATGGASGSNPKPGAGSTFCFTLPDGQPQQPACPLRPPSA